MLLTVDIEVPKDSSQNRLADLLAALLVAHLPVWHNCGCFRSHSENNNLNSLNSRWSTIQKANRLRFQKPNLQDPRYVPPFQCGHPQKESLPQRTACPESAKGWSASSAGLAPAAAKKVATGAGRIVNSFFHPATELSRSLVFESAWRKCKSKTLETPRLSVLPSPRRIPPHPARASWWCLYICCQRFNHGWSFLKWWFFCHGDGLREEGVVFCGHIGSLNHKCITVYRCAIADVIG